jgi:uncharacterized protein
MEVPRDSLLLRIFIGESDRFQHKPLYEAIVLKAREMHLAGATVLRGPMGLGNRVECTPQRFCDSRWIYR